jgi:glutamyl/glutaminyl-tRNA synthetase
LNQFPGLLSPFLKVPHYDPIIRDTVLVQHGPMLDDFSRELGDITEWDPSSIKDVIHSIADSNRVSYREAAHALRFALTGSSVGISIDKFVHVFGVVATKDRITHFKK